VAKNSASDKVSMFEDLMTGLQDILMRLETPGGFSDDVREENLVKKNIVPSDTSTFNKMPPVKGILNSNEKTRAYNIGVEWARAFFDVQKLNKASVDTSKPSTVISKARETVGKGTAMKEGLPSKPAGGLGLAAGILGVLAAAYAIWEMFGSEGGFVMKAISKLPSFLKLLKGTAGKIGAKLLKRVKFIPFIGALAGFVFAFQRFQDGHWFKGTLEIISAIASLTGVGLPLSYIIDGALLLHDLAEEKGDETGTAATAVKGGKYATKAIISVLKKTATKVGTKLLSVLKFIPFIGGVAGLALSYMRFQEGEWIAGIFEFVSAILDFIPGVGNIASYIIDGGLLLYDLLKTPTGSKEEKAKTQSKYGFSFSNGMAYIKETIGPALTKALPYIPVIGNFAAIYDGVKLIMDGRVGDGVRKLIQGMFIFLPPGLSDHLITGYDWLMSMFTDDSQQSQLLSSQPSKPFSQKIKEYIQTKLHKLPTIMQDALRMLGILDDDKPVETVNQPTTNQPSTSVAAQSTQTATTNQPTTNQPSTSVAAQSTQTASTNQPTTNQPSTNQPSTSVAGQSTQTVVEAPKPAVDSGGFMKKFSLMHLAFGAALGPVGALITAPLAIMSSQSKSNQSTSAPVENVNATTSSNNTTTINVDDKVSDTSKSESSSDTEKALNDSLDSIQNTFNDINTKESLKGMGDTLSTSLNNMQNMLSDVKAPDALNGMLNAFTGIVAGNSDVKVQTDMIREQNNILLEIAYLTRQQLELTKRKPAVIVNDQGSSSNTANFSNDAFNTGTQSSRALYGNSPYTLSNA